MKIEANLEKQGIFANIAKISQSERNFAKLANLCPASAKRQHNQQ